MRSLSAVALSALMLSGVFALPAVAQEDPELPGVRVTITPRSYLSPGNQVRPQSARDYAKSNLSGNTFLSSNYNGVKGFERYPLHDTLDLPYSSSRYVLRAPDRVR